MKQATGKISFINHQKKYVMIEYEDNGKKKTIKGNITGVAAGVKEKEGNKKQHHYIIGDVVKFTIKMSGQGDRMIAEDLSFMYNTGVDVLINKARMENRFTGYLKIADGKYFIKEIDSYLFLPLSFSSWQILPGESELNEPVEFYLENIEKKDKITASLFENTYIPEFLTAVKLFKSKATISSEIFKISPYGIYVNLVGDRIQAKINPAELDPEYIKQLKVGDKIEVIITHLTKSRIAIEPANVSGNMG